ncbi:MAG: Crp/Fnr family transcriptional regulator [Aquabacterium sp.]
MYFSTVVEQALNTVLALLASPAGIVALISAGVAGALQVAGTFWRTMIPLRFLAVGSNVGFVIYGALFPSLPMMVLHAVLLPINIVRAVQMVRLARRVNAAADDNDTSGLWLAPYMKRRRFKADSIIFRKGDRASQLYLLAEGRIELVEAGVVLEPGRVFGEIAFFSPDRQRTQTARCLERCLLLTISESTVRQLYFQNPQFGFELIGLVASRLTADIKRLEGVLARSDRIVATPQPAAAVAQAVDEQAARPRSA